MIRFLVGRGVKWHLDQPEYNALLHAVQVDDLNVIYAVVTGVFETGQGLASLMPPPSLPAVQVEEKPIPNSSTQQQQEEEDDEEAPPNRFWSFLVSVFSFLYLKI